MNEQKEIYASIEIGDHEVRLVAGEFYETRFHILRVERCELQGIEHKMCIRDSSYLWLICKGFSLFNRGSFLYCRTFEKRPNYHGGGCQAPQSQRIDQCVGNMGSGAY